MNYSVVIREDINEILEKHLIRLDGQEDLCFALYTIYNGKNRTTGLINKLILPEHGDRNIHGNVSFNPNYLNRVIEIALKEGKGIAFIHSHPSSGWQNMSDDDVNTERMLAPRAKAVIGVPLLGMTLGNDGAWSARFWTKYKPRTYSCSWCESVRIVGNKYLVTYNDKLLIPPSFNEEFMRTISAWGENQQSKLARIRVGIVGLGSVGSQISEALIRTGLENVSLIDFDTIEKRNLDRLPRVRKDDVGYLKSDYYSRYLEEIKLNSSQSIRSLPFSIAEKDGLEAILDCDVVFCCVDRPWPRFILNMIAASCYIPVIDGGINASYNPRKRNIEQARWRTYTSGPLRRCMKCMEQYYPEDVSLEQSGLLEDPKYISNLPPEHFANRGENVYAFSLSLASMQIQQFLSLILTPKGVYYGPKEMDFITGNIDFKFDYLCDEGCEFTQMDEMGNGIKNILIQGHEKAAQSRNKALKYNDSIIKKVLKKLGRVNNGFKRRFNLVE